MIKDYHIFATQLPLEKGEDGMFHVVLSEIPDTLDMRVMEATVNEYGGFATFLFIETREHVGESVVKSPKVVVPSA